MCANVGLFVQKQTHVNICFYICIRMYACNSDHRRSQLFRALSCVCLGMQNANSPPQHIKVQRTQATLWPSASMPLQRTASTFIGHNHCITSANIEISSGHGRFCKFLCALNFLLLRFVSFYLPRIPCVCVPFQPNINICCKASRYV